MPIPRIRQSPEPQSIGIVIVDDHIFIRDLMVRMITRQRSRYSVLAAVGTASEAKASCGKFQPELLILDINLPDQSGIDALPDLRRIAPSTRVLLCTAFPTDHRIRDLANSGAHGFVEKTNTWDEFLQAIERVSQGEYYFCSRNRGLRSLPSHSPSGGDAVAVAPHLTCRENEILALIAEGFTTKEIGNKLHISAATVTTHRTNLMKKLNVRNAPGLVKYAFHAKIVPPHSIRSNRWRVHGHPQSGSER
jgi:DNA-binding NarL/FixJ family response regulator